MLTLIKTAISFAFVALFNKLFFFPRITGQTQTIWAFNSQQSPRKNWLEQNTAPSNRTSQTDEIKTADDNLRVDLFFKLSNSGCALCHAVLSHTKRNKRKQHESETGSLQRRVCVCYYSNIASTTWNRGLNTVRSAVCLCVGDQTSTQGEGTPVGLDSPWRKARGRKRKTLTNRGGDVRLRGTLKKCHVFQPFGRGS